MQSYRVTAAKSLDLGTTFTCGRSGHGSHNSRAVRRALSSLLDMSPLSAPTPAAKTRRKRTMSSKYQGLTPKASTSLASAFGLRGPHIRRREAYEVCDSAACESPRRYGDRIVQCAAERRLLSS